MTTRRGFMLVAAVAAAGLPGVREAFARGRIDGAKIDSALEAFIRSKALVGASALVYEEERAGVAFMMFYEGGKLELDDPLEKHAPEFSNMRVYAGIDPHGEVIYEPLRRPVTLRDITRHTAVFYNGTDHTPLGEIVRAADHDYMRFARMLQNGGELDGKRLLKAETVKLMSTNAMPREVTDTSWLPSKGSVGFGIDFAVRLEPPANAPEASGAVGELALAH